MFGFTINRALLLAGIRLGIPEALALMNVAPPPRRSVPPAGRIRSQTRGSGKQFLIVDRSSSVKKFRREVRAKVASSRMSPTSAR